MWYSYDIIMWYIFDIKKKLYSIKWKFGIAIQKHNCTLYPQKYQFLYRTEMTVALWEKKYFAESTFRNPIPWKISKLLRKTEYRLFWVFPFKPIVNASPCTLCPPMPAMGETALFLSYNWIWDMRFSKSFSVKPSKP